VKAELGLARRWYLVPDGLPGEEPVVTASFESDPAAGAPRARLSPGGAEFPFVHGSGAAWSARISLAGLSPGEYAVELIERVAGAGDVASARAEVSFRVSRPEYVVWTLDFEGDASGDAELANTAAIADGLNVPMSILWNPRAWTTAQVSGERQEAMLAWAKARLAKGDEVGLHLHMWTDFVRAAGVAARAAPSWAGRGDGYDVPIQTYSEEEQRDLVAYGTRLMTERGLPRPTSFRAGGDMGDATTLRVLAAQGFTVDCSAVPRTAPPIGRIPYPWTLAAEAQPYRPSGSDANAMGDLTILEAPTIGGNTYGFTVRSIQAQLRANLAVFAPAGGVATERRAITIVSHPGTIAAPERAAIEALLAAFAPLRYDRDAGPVRFVTLAQLAQAYSR